MIKDKIIKMDNGKSYYVLEDITHMGKKYLLTIECDLEKDEANEEDYLVMELTLDNDDVVIKKIEDDNLAAIVTAKLLQEIRNAE